VGKNQEAKAELEKTRNLQKVADQTVFNKLHGAQTKGKTTNGGMDGPP
jgi:hypothetical protein